MEMLHLSEVVKGLNAHGRRLDVLEEKFRGVGEVSQEDAAVEREEMTSLREALTSLEERVAAIEADPQGLKATARKSTPAARK